jgi:diaminohydroxyphosphoribosylaminopyrimidine deaminase/5-amino-6-(5-phosphoribosylamino)uracil reductase
VTHGHATDERHIARCLELALVHKGNTAPNPVVGCVVVDARGEVIAEGVHKKAGGPHAEVDALAKIGNRAPGGTLYVNLEPCSHHGRTPPCAPVVAASGVARVVVGAADPIAGHAGGAELLRERGIAVTVGVLEAACLRANRGFYAAARGERPAFTLKAAMTLDGKIATVSGESKWITGEDARADGRRLRHEHDGILVGIGTVLADDPQLTCRLDGGRDPTRIIVDTDLRTPPKAKALPAIILCGAKAPAARERALVKKGAQVWRTRQLRSGRIDLRAAGAALVKAGIQSVLVEGGAEVHASLMAADLADDLILYVASLAVGGPAKSWLGGVGVAKLASAHRFRHVELPRLLPGGDVRLGLERAVAER